MKKIAIDVRMINNSGIGTYIKNVVPSIIEALPQYQFILLGNKNELSQYMCASNVELLHCMAPIYSINEQIKIKKLVPYNVDLFWSPHYNIPLAYSGKLLVTIHDVFHLEMEGNLHKLFYAKLMFYAISRKADAILCVSRFTKSQLLKHIKYDASSIFSIPNGVNAEWFSISKQRIKHTRPYLLYVGNVKPHKNLVRLLKSYKLICNFIPHDLIIVGKKEGFITGDQTVIEMATHLKERVIFTGYVNQNELQQYFINATALIFPSLYEGFGLPAIEAMACRCPVVASNAASLPEVCGDAAIYFNPYSIEEMAEKLLHITKDVALRNRLIEKGLERAKHFLWQKSADATLEAIYKVL